MNSRMATRVINLMNVYMLNICFKIYKLIIIAGETYIEIINFVLNYSSTFIRV